MRVVFRLKLRVGLPKLEARFVLGGGKKLCLQRLYIVGAGMLRENMNHRFFDSSPHDPAAKNEISDSGALRILNIQGCDSG